MLKCPECKHIFYEEKIIPFGGYFHWNKYVEEKMSGKGSKRFILGKKISIQSTNATARVLAEWDGEGEGYGYVSEVRVNWLKRLTYQSGDRR